VDEKRKNHAHGPKYKSERNNLDASSKGKKGVEVEFSANVRG